MLTYKAMYKYLDEGVHAEVLDFPGVISLLCRKARAAEKDCPCGAIWDAGSRRCEVC